MDKSECRCGKSSVEFICVGEDLFSVKLEHAKAKTIRKKGIIEYRCIECGELITTADKYMMVRD